MISFLVEQNNLLDRAHRAVKPGFRQKWLAILCSTRNGEAVGQSRTTTFCSTKKLEIA